MADTENTWLLDAHGYNEIGPSDGGDDLTDMSPDELPTLRELLIDWAYIEDVEFTLTSPDGQMFEWQHISQRWVPAT